MAVHYRTKGFFLREIERGEADKLFVVYTKDFGKLKILGKAIRKIKSKLRAGARQLCLSEIEFIQGKTHKTLTDTILIDSFLEIRKDLEKLKTAFQINDVLDKLVQDEEKDEKVWSLLSETFERLSNWKLEFENSLKIENCKLKIIYYYFLWNLLSILGYQPDFYKCSVCQKKLEPFNLYFDADQGGVVCQKCAGKESIEITSEVVKVLRIILKRDWSLLSRLKIDEENQKLLDKVSQEYLSYFGT